MKLKSILDFLFLVYCSLFERGSRNVTLFFCLKNYLYICIMEQEKLYDTIVELRTTVLELQEDLRQAKEQLILRQ